MKPHKVIFSFLFLFAAFQVCFAQDEAKAVLLDEFERTSCADLQSRIRIGLNQALKNLNSTSYIVIYGKKNDLFENLFYESWIKGIIELEDKSRIKVIRGEEKDKFSVQIWNVPDNSSLEFFKEAEWNYSLPKTIKPFVFITDLPESGICPFASHVKLFADILIENPKARGHLVIRDKTSKNFQIREKEVLDELVNQYKVPRNQLKLFYIEDKNHPHDNSYVEFWLVPRGKK